MTRPVKILSISLWALCVAAMIGVLTQWLLTHDHSAPAAIVQPQPDVPDPAFSAPDFSLTDQLGRTVTTASLRGHPFIVSFIFTTCATDCPLVTLRFSQLQSRIPPEVKFISISVDPGYDTPSVLLKYADQPAYHADNDRWRFLTGPHDQVYAAIRGLKVSIEEKGANQIEHDLNFNLYDSQGRFRGHYNSKDPGEIEQLVSVVPKLLAQEAGEHQP